MRQSHSPFSKPVLYLVINLKATYRLAIKFLSSREKKKTDMREPKIIFQHNQKQYKVSMDAYDTSHIKLPDGTMLRVGVWQETYPPRPAFIKEVGDIFIKDFTEAVEDTQYEVE